MKTDTASLFHRLATSTRIPAPRIVVVPKELPTSATFANRDAIDALGAEVGSVLRVREGRKGTGAWCRYEVMAIVGNRVELRPA